MAEEREMYKGREIVIKTEERPLAARTREGTEEFAEEERESTEKKPELYIDGKHISTVREPSGVYRAARHVYSPERSLKDIAKKLIDYEEAISNGR